jgi:hypothetical protein
MSNKWETTASLHYVIKKWRKKYRQIELTYFNGSFGSFFFFFAFCAVAVVVMGIATFSTTFFVSALVASPALYAAALNAFFK